MKKRRQPEISGVLPPSGHYDTVENETLPLPRSQFLAGIKAIAPILLGIVPFGTIAGVAAVEIGLSPRLAIGMSLLIYAGAAQLAAYQLLALDASPFIIVLTALIINLRSSDFVQAAYSIRIALQHLL